MREGSVLTARVRSQRNVLAVTTSAHHVKMVVFANQFSGAIFAAVQTLTMDPIVSILFVEAFNVTNVSTVSTKFVFQTKKPRRVTRGHFASTNIVTTESASQIASALKMKSPVPHVMETILRPSVDIVLMDMPYRIPTKSETPVMMETN